MSPPRCPGQDPRYWKPEDIHFAKCPFCGAEIEFWKDEPVRPCPACGREVPHPKLDAGCTQWCRHADECADAHATPPSGAQTPDEPPPAPSDGQHADGS